MSQHSPQVAACTLAAAAVVGLFHALLFVFVPYADQDFPLMDDWAYSLGGFSFLRGDGPKYFHWSALPLMGQWIWSAPWVYLLGETNQAMRLSTAAAHVTAAAAAAFALGRIRPLFGFIASMTLTLHPVFALAGVTFLSDAPTLAFSLAAIVAWERTVNLGGSSAMVVASVAGLLAVANRQTAVAAPAAMLVGLWGRGLLLRAWTTTLSCAIALLVGLATAWWIWGRPDAIHHPLLRPSPLHMLDAFVHAALFCGLGATPALVALPLPKRLAPRLLHFAAGAALLAGAILALGGNPLESAAPFSTSLGNLLTRHGSFGDVFMIGRREELFTDQVLVGLSFIAIAAAGLLYAHVAELPRQAWVSPIVVFGMFHLALLIISRDLYDRYYLPLLMGVLGLLSACNHRDKPRPSGLGAAVACVLILAIGSASFALCRDWLAWNSARWELGRRVVASGIPLDEIEGGLEWDFWHAWRSRTPRFSPRRTGGFAVPIAMESLPHITGRYALSFGVDPRFKVVDRLTYYRWLPPRREEMVLLQGR